MTAHAIESVINAERASGAVDLSDPDLYAYGDPHRAWRDLRETAPVSWNVEADGPGFWSIVSHAHAVTVYRRGDWFSSERGIVLRADRWNPDPAGGRMLALTDAPRHGKVRAIVNRAFTPRTIARLGETARATSAQLVADALEREPCEFVDEVAARLPVAMICSLMGVPEADWDEMYVLTRRAFGADDPVYRTSSSPRVSAAEAHSEIMLYYRRLALARRADPRDDVVSALACGTVDGRLLSVKEILLQCDNLIVAGQETARHAIAGGLLALIDAPEQWERLEREPAFVASAAEEILRWTSPAMHVMRTAREEVQLGGATIRRGDAVVVWNPSANRDSAVFQEPDRFDVARAPNRHVALGVGAHYCLGASLVRLELQSMLSELVRAVRRAHLAGPVVRLRSNAVAGFTSLPVVLEPR